MNEAAQLQAPASEHDFWDIVRRTLAAIVILVALMALAMSAAGLIGIWVARAPARSAMTSVAMTLNNTLARVDQALASVGASAERGRQAVARVDAAANALGDRIEAGSPALAALAGAVRDDLAPKIDDARASAATLRDGVVAVNTALETLNRLPFVSVPTLTDELSALSDRVEAAQNDAQDLRAAVAEARSDASARFVGTVTAGTSKIDAGLAQISATAATHQGAVAQRQQQVADLADTLLLAINLLVVLLSVLFLLFAAGQVLLIYVCWQYVRAGRFPSLRATRR